MSEFEFVAVLLSIIFGLAITQVLAGTVRLLYGDHIDDVHLAWALMIIVGPWAGRNAGSRDVVAY